MDPAVRTIIRQLKEAMPPICVGREVDHLTGGALCWQQIEEWASNGTLPSDCFVFDGKKKLVFRDRLLSWWGEWLSAETKPWRKHFEKLLEPVIANIRDSDVEAAIVHLDRRKAEINRRYSRSRAALSSPLPAPPAGPAGV
jgi:hypothetical protein